MIKQMRILSLILNAQDVPFTECLLDSEKSNRILSPCLQGLCSLEKQAKQLNLKIQ